MTAPGSLLRQARRQAGLTQSRLAALAGTSQTALSAYESGARQPALDTFLRLIAATGNQLAVEPARGNRPRVPPPARLRQVARTLPEVIALAEALPHRHGRELAFPAVEPRPGGP